MNQILYTTENKTHGPLPIKTIVKFFAFAIIMLGVIFLGEGAYSLITNINTDNSPIQITKPDIEFSKSR